MGSSPTARTNIYKLTYDKMNYLILILVILFSLNVSSESFDEKIKKFLLNNPEIIFILKIINKFIKLVRAVGLEPTRVLPPAGF